MTLSHSCAEVRAAIELSFTMVSGVTPDTHVLDGGPHASSGRVDFGVVGLHWPNGFNVVLIVVVPSSVLSVYYDKICLIFASH